MPERDLQSKGILSYFSRSERQRRHIEKYRSRLPWEAVTKIESASEGEVMLRAFKCLDKINRMPGGSMVGTKELTVNWRNTVPQLEMLVDAILRESALGVPQLRDVITIQLASEDHTHFGQNWHLSEDDIARKVNDRLLIKVNTIHNGYDDFSYVGSGGSTSYIVTETTEFGIYGHIVHKSPPRRGGRQP